MKLSPEFFRELTTVLIGKDATLDSERRRSARVEVQTRVQLSLMNKDEHMPAVPILVRDVSPRGIKILYPQELRAGQQFTIHLEGGESNKSIALLCTVMHSKQLSSGLHSVGAEFTCVLPNAPEKPPLDGEAMKRIRDSVLK